MSKNKKIKGLSESKIKEKMLKYLLKDVDISDKIYQQSFKDTYKVNIDVCGLKGYQIYKPDKYISEYGRSLEDADVDIMFRDVDYIKQLLRKEKVDTEKGRAGEDIVHINRRDTLISTRTKRNKRNAQVLLAKIPMFKEVVKNFGTSRLSKPLRDQPDSIEPVQEGEIESLMKKMLAESVDVNDPKYQKDFQESDLKVNWDVNGNLAYQIFEETSYNYEFGKNLENADLTLTIENPEYAKRFLQPTPTNFAPGLDEDDNLLIDIKIPVLTIKFKDPEETLYSLAKLPFIRDLLIRSDSEEEKEDDRENYGHYVSVNLPMGEVENVVVPYKVFEYFINKASNIVLRTCPCRERWDCQNYPIELGCIFMGDDTKNMALSPEEGYVATKEQALEHVRKAIDSGLVPLIGRNTAEAEGGHGVKDTGRFLGGCFCCECCCIGVKTREYGAYSSMAGEDPGSIEGMKIKVDYEKCIGCGECVEACPFDFRKVVDDKISVDTDKCIGCGRCIDVCKNGAISVDIDDPDYIENFIEKIESIVDVTDQTTNN